MVRFFIRRTHLHEYETWTHIADLINWWSRRDSHSHKTACKAGASSSSHYPIKFKRFFRQAYVVPTPSVNVTLFIFRIEPNSYYFFSFGNLGAGEKLISIHVLPPKMAVRQGYAPCSFVLEAKLFPRTAYYKISPRFRKEIFTC